MEFNDTIHYVESEQKLSLYKKRCEELSHKLDETKDELIRSNANIVGEKIQHQQLAVDLLQTHQEKMQLLEFVHFENKFTLEEKLDESNRIIRLEKSEKEQLRDAVHENRLLEEFELLELKYKALEKLDHQEIQYKSHIQNLEKEIVDTNRKLVTETIQKSDLKSSLDKERAANRLLVEKLKIQTVKMKNLGMNLSRRGRKAQFCKIGQQTPLQGKQIDINVAWKTETNNG